MEIVEGGSATDHYGKLRDSKFRSLVPAKLHATPDPTSQPSNHKNLCTHLGKGGFTAFLQWRNLGLQWAQRPNASNHRLENYSNPIMSS